MAKPEQLVIDKLKRALVKWCEKRDVPLRVDKVPAAMMNSGGRPDLYVDIAHFHLRIEAKADKGKMSKLQELYFEKDALHDVDRCVLIVGKDGVDNFMNGLPALLDLIAIKQMIKAEQWLTKPK